MIKSLAYAACAAAMAAAACAHAQQPVATDWGSYNRDLGGTRFSPLKAVTPANVGQLQVAWTYHMKPATAARMLGSTATPLVVRGVMYAATPYNQVVALDATTGTEKWVYTLPGGDAAAARGIEYWAGDAKTPARIIFGTRRGKLMALNAADGAPVASFGVGGIVDMKTPDVMQGLPDASLGLSGTPVIWGGLIITGSQVQERPVKGAAGDIRAWDVKTGKLAWTFHTLPRKGEFGYDTWQEGGTFQRSGVNVWTFMTVDTKTGVLYAPIAAPALDRYGGDRKGANLYANSLVALDAKTGKRLWHYQTIHHDIWDNDLPAQPVLFDIKHGKTTIPAVAIVNKSSLLFILNRKTGKPIYEVKETPFPSSDVPTEVASTTQPIPQVTPPLARTTFDPAKDLVSLTPELRAFCEKRIADEKLLGSTLFEPLKFNQMMVRFPGSGGGANWGGAAFDPISGYYLINMNNVGSVEDIVLKDGQYQSGAGPNSWFSDNAKKLPCQEPPWGTVVAVDVNTGKIAWEAKLGVTESMPEGKRDTGRPNVGGLMATAGGLTFVGATDDARLRAFETKTGKEVWTVKLGAAAHNTPITYQGADGRQYVSVTAAGGSYLASPATDDSIVAYALPK